MCITLNGSLMQTRKDAHDHLKEQLHLPDYYGRNLDALFDMLTECSIPTHIELIHRSTMLDALGSYGEILIETIQQAADENANISFTAQ